MLARQIAIGFGVAIIFPLLIYYGVSTFSHPTKQSDFFLHSGGYNIGKMTPEQRAELIDKRKAETAAATAAYTEAARVFGLRLLCVSAPLGYAAILLGSLRLSSGLGAGLMFGGIFAVINGYRGYWSFVEDWLRLVSLLIAMAVLIFVSYRVRRPAGKTT